MKIAAKQMKRNPPATIPNDKWWEGIDAKPEYKSDLSEISSENSAKINNMSQEEIKSAVADIHKSFNPQVLEMFKNIAKQQMKPQNPVKIQYEDDVEERINTDLKNTSKQIEEAAEVPPIKSEMISDPLYQTSKSPVSLVVPQSKESSPEIEFDKSNISGTEILIHKDGSYKFGKKEALESKSLLISDLVNISGDLESKYFSTNDLVFLLHSTYVPHRLLSLGLVQTFTERNIIDLDLIKSVLLDRDILDAGFNVLACSPGITPVYQLKLFGLLN